MKFSIGKSALVYSVSVFVSVGLFGCASDGGGSDPSAMKTEEVHGSRAEPPATKSEMAAFSHDIFIGKVVSGPEYTIDEFDVPWTMVDVAVIDSIQGSMKGKVRVGYESGPDERGVFLKFEGAPELVKNDTYVMGTRLSPEGFHSLVGDSSSEYPQKVTNSQIGEVKRAWKEPVANPDKEWLRRYQSPEKEYGQRWVDEAYARSKVSD